MSDNATMAPGASSDPGAAAAQLYNAAGEPLRTASQAASSQTDQLVDFVKQRPVTAALTALVVGYLLGKIT